MMTETNQKRTAVEFDLNTLEPVMDDNSINNTVTAADRMKQYIDIEVKGTGRRPTYKQLEAASKGALEPFPRIKMLEYQNEEIQAQSAFINNENNNNIIINKENNNNINGGSPLPRQKSPEAENVSRADNRRRMDRLCLTVSLRRAIGARAMSRTRNCSTRSPGSTPTPRRWSSRSRSRLRT